MRQTATAFAPASIGNVAVGFDVLGHSFQAIGDRVTARRIAERGVRIASITGTTVDLPRDPERNTAGMAVLCMTRELGLDFGIELSIEKGIPLGSETTDILPTPGASNGSTHTEPPNFLIFSTDSAMSSTAM